MAKDYYLILGVPLDAAPDEIRSAFRKLAFRYHPDRRGGASSGAFQRISEVEESETLGRGRVTWHCMGQIQMRCRCTTGP